jgi:hypothetical protein
MDSSMIGVIVRSFWQIALNQRGPDTLPNSRFLLGVVIAVRILTEAGWFLVLYHATSAWLMLQVYFLWYAGVLAFFQLTLKWTRKSDRLQQTLTAFLGAECLIDLFAWPIFFLDPSSGLSTLLYLINVFWTIHLLGFLIHRALDIQRIEGVIYAILLFVFLRMLAGAVVGG